ncbi:MAG: hypothetical protein ACLQNE_35560 [Thermoguttaceae bacterium]
MARTSKACRRPKLSAVDPWRPGAPGVYEHGDGRLYVIGRLAELKGFRRATLRRYQKHCPILRRKILFKPVEWRKANLKRSGPGAKVGPANGTLKVVVYALADLDEIRKREKDLPWVGDLLTGGALERKYGIPAWQWADWHQHACRHQPGSSALHAEHVLAMGTKGPRFIWVFDPKEAERAAKAEKLSPMRKFYSDAGEPLSGYISVQDLRRRIGCGAQKARDWIRVGCEHLGGLKLSTTRAYWISRRGRRWVKVVSEDDVQVIEKAIREAALQGAGESLLSLHQAAKEFATTRGTLRQLINQGILTYEPGSQKRGHHRRGAMLISRASLRAYFGTKKAARSGVTSPSGERLLSARQGDTAFGLSSGTVKHWHRDAVQFMDGEKLQGSPGFVETPRGRYAAVLYPESEIARYKAARDKAKTDGTLQPQRKRPGKAASQPATSVANPAGDQPSHGIQAGAASREPVTPVAGHGMGIAGGDSDAHGVPKDRLRTLETAVEYWQPRERKARDAQRKLVDALRKDPEASMKKIFLDVSGVASLDKTYVKTIYYRSLRGLKAFESSIRK